jgi:regulator of sigma E protease
VLTIDGRPVESFPDMQQIVSTSAGETLTFEVERGGTHVTLKAVPTLKESKDRFGNVHRIGVLGITRSPSPEDTHFQPVGPLTALELGVQKTWFVVERTLSYIGGVVSGREAADQLGGPIRIAQVSGQVATEGLPSLFSLTAVLSVSIGLLNLFPVPLLDGGHLLFYAIEATRGKPLSERAQEVGLQRHPASRRPMDGIVARRQLSERKRVGRGKDSVAQQEKACTSGASTGLFRGSDDLSRGRWVVRSAQRGR